MDLEMVLNELSLRTPAADIPTARQWMSDLLATIRTATAQGVKKVIRTQSDFQSTILAPNYPVARWRNDNTVDREARRFFTTLISKAPFLADVLDAKLEDNVDLSEFKHQGTQASGLGVAYLLETLALSVASEECWDCNRLELELRRLDENGELIDEIVEIVHASCSNHVQENTDWIKKRIRTGVLDGAELWNRKEELFPSLIFCEAVAEQLQSLGLENPILQFVKNRLLELEGCCNSGTEQAFEPKSLRNVSPESQVTLQHPKYGKERTFLCPDGKERIFSWHAKLSFGWRIYFFPYERKMIIGYVGCHLRTVKYSK